MSNKRKHNFAKPVEETPVVEIEEATPVSEPLPVGIRYVEKYKKYHAELNVAKQTLHIGFFDTLAAAEAAINREKLTYNL